MWWNWVLPQLEQITATHGNTGPVPKEVSGLAAELANGTITGPS